MSFIWPSVLVSLLLVPACIIAYLRLQQRRRRDAVGLGTFGAGGYAGARRSGRLRHIPPAVFLLGLTLLLVASARPQMVLPLPQMEGTVVLTFDVSASMAADDVQPTRMDAAKSAAQAFVDDRPRSTKIGVVAFGEGGLVVQAPTDDTQAISATIDRMVPQSGTSLGRGILAALDLVSLSLDLDESFNGEAEAAPTSEPVPRGAFAPAIIVLLTDGENTEPPDPLEAAQAAIEQGVRIYIVGVGTSEGATLEIDGFNLFTRLNEATLQEIALLTEGRYLRVESVEDVQSVYDDLDPQFVVKPREMEVTSILAGVSMLVLLVGGALSLLWFGRMP